MAAIGTRWRAACRLIGPVLLSMGLTACGLPEFLGLKPPARLPQLNERAIAGPGSLGHPRWSPDGHSLAFMDEHQEELVIYDLGSQGTRRAGTGVSLIDFEWHPANRLSYLRQHIRRGGPSSPIISELHVVNRDGQNDRLIWDNLLQPTFYTWLKNGNQIVMLLSEAESLPNERAVYLLDTTTQRQELLLTREQLKVQHITNIALAPDDSQLFIYGQREIGAYSLESWGFVYDLKTRHVIAELKLTGVFQRPVDNPSLRESFGPADFSFLRAGQQGWVAGKLMATEGACYNYSVFFLNLDDSFKNFCIPSTRGAISDVALSPDLQRVAFVTVVGPGNNWIMVGDLTPEYRSRLEK